MTQDFLKMGKSFQISTEKCDETALDCSKQDFGPGEVIVLSWWLSTEVTAGLEVVDISGNPISGAGKKYSNSTAWDKDIDADLVGVTALAKELPGSRIKVLILSECGLGPKSIDATIDDPWHQGASTLGTAGVEALDLSNNPFDPGDLEAPANMKISVDGCAIPESQGFDDY